MKVIKCEMCNSSDVIKQDGFFVCQSCGTKYSTEEAKKLMVEGTVKIDSSDELKNLYEIARRARQDNNFQNAHKYYDMILSKDPSSWEANFYCVYFQTANCKIYEIESAGILLTNCLENVILLLNKEKTAQENILNEIFIRLYNLAGALNLSAWKHYNEIDNSIQHEYVDEVCKRCQACANILYTYGNLIEKYYSFDIAKNISVSAWKKSKEIISNIRFVRYIDILNDQIIGIDAKIAKYDLDVKADVIERIDRTIKKIPVKRSVFKFSANNIKFIIAAVGFYFFGCFLGNMTTEQLGQNYSGINYGHLIGWAGCGIFALVAIISLLTPKPSKNIVEINKERKEKLIDIRDELTKIN